MSEKDVEAGDDIKENHYRYERTRNHAYSLDTTNDDDCDHCSQDRTTHPASHTEVGVCNVGDIPCLEHISAGCRGQHDAKRKKDSQRLSEPGEFGFYFGECLVRDPHWTAMWIVRIIRIAIEHR